MFSSSRNLYFMVVILLCSVVIIASSRVSSRVSNRVSSRVSNRVSNRVSSRVSNRVSSRVSSRVSNRRKKVNLPQEFLSQFKSIINPTTQSAIKAINYRFDFTDPEVFRAGKPLSARSSSGYTMTTRRSTDCTNELLKIGAIYEEVVRKLQNRYSLTNRQIQYLPQLDLKNTMLKNLVDKSCLQPISFCDPHVKFRSMDGSCNNRANPQWGRALTGQGRLIPSDFSDGICHPRNISSLPSPRHVSVKIHSNLDKRTSSFTAMIFQFGQFLDHDLILTPVQPISTGKGRGAMEMVDCCETSSEIDACLMPIEIRGDDEFFKQHNKNCLAFSRSSFYPNFGSRTPINQNTAYIDGSMIYGSSLSQSISLRSTNGRLKVQTCRGQKDLLPGSDNILGCEAQNGRSCFIAGDSRVNEQRSLTAFHTMWMREHNRIAGILSKVNPKWGDEQIYQESRKIVIAQLQHITFNEFLPVVLGPENIRKFGLNVLDNSFKYSPTTDASITLGFSSAAYRFGHTILPSLLSLTNNNYV